MIGLYCHVSHKDSRTTLSIPWRNVSKTRKIRAFASDYYSLFLRATESRRSLEENVYSGENCQILPKIKGCNWKAADLQVPPTEGGNTRKWGHAHGCERDTATGWVLFCPKYNKNIMTQHKGRSARLVVTFPDILEFSGVCGYVSESPK